jgi:hypothetical protein
VFMRCPPWWIDINDAFIKSRNERLVDIDFSH